MARFTKKKAYILDQTTFGGKLDNFLWLHLIEMIR